MDFQKFYFSAKGRVNRKQFWLRLMLPVFAVGIILVILDAALGTRDPESVGLFLGLFSLIWSLIIIFPSILVNIKRFHDRDKSGWWVLIALVPLIGPLWLLIELGFLNGTPGPNRFGPPVTD